MTHSKKRILYKIIPRFHQLNSSVRDDERKKTRQIEDLVSKWSEIFGWSELELFSKDKFPLARQFARKIILNNASHAEHRVCIHHWLARWMTHRLELGGHWDQVRIRSNS